MSETVLKTIEDLNNATGFSMMPIIDELKNYTNHELISGLSDIFHKNIELKTQLAEAVEALHTQWECDGSNENLITRIRKSLKEKEIQA